MLPGGRHRAMKSALRNALLLVLMLSAGGLAIAMRPTQKVADKGPALQLETAIPHAFNGWREAPEMVAQIVDPLQKEMLQKIYTQTLSRTYIDAQGNRVMLSIAYGEDQRDAVQLHYPEVCYPAQGFEIISNYKSTLEIRRQKIPVRRLETQLGQRREPITYWTIIGDKAVLGGVDKKLAELDFGLQRKIPDGLLFRVSSINQESQLAFALHKRFVENLIDAVEPDIRKKISGLQ